MLPALQYQLKAFLGAEFVGELLMLDRGQRTLNTWSSQPRFFCSRYPRPQHNSVCLVETPSPNRVTAPWKRTSSTARSQVILKWPYVSLVIRLASSSSVLWAVAAATCICRRYFTRFDVERASNGRCSLWTPNPSDVLRMSWGQNRARRNGIPAGGDRENRCRGSK